MKPKISGKIFKLFFLFSLSAIINSCVVEELSFDKVLFSDQSLVMEAEEWYAKSYSRNNNARISNLVEGNPQWNKAKTTSHKGRSVIEIPIKLQVENIYAQENKTFRKRIGDYRLLLFQIGDEKFKPYILKIESEIDNPDSKNINKLSFSEIPEDFSGDFIFFNLDGSFVGTWKIENGEKTRGISFKGNIKNEQTPPANGRISNWTYTCTVTTFTTYVQAGSGQPEIVAQVEVWDCLYTHVPSTIAPPADPGTSGEDPGCVEPHPYIEGFMIPCGSLDPDSECPCCHLPESQRADCEADEPPCEDLVLKTMEIASPGASGKNGGRYGMTRSNGNKFHDGLDVFANIGTYAYSPFIGTVIEIKSSFAPGSYQRASYGNYVTIKSVDFNGDEFYFKYNHLDYVLVNIGDSIVPGQAFGISGSTGNAASNDVKNKHVHIQARGKDSNGNWTIKKNPEDFLKIKYNSSGSILTNPCN